MMVNDQIVWERELYKPLWEVIKGQTYKHYRDDWSVKKHARQSRAVLFK